MGGEGARTEKGSSSSAPWVKQKGYLADLYKRASALSMDPREMFPGEMLAAEDPATLASRAAIEDRATAGSPLLRSAQDYTSSVLGGDWLTSNPFLDATYDRLAKGVTRNYEQSVLPQLDTRFARAGARGGSGYRGALGESARALAGELSGAATDLYGGNYQAERDRMEAATGRAPALAEADYSDPMHLGEVGAARTSRAQDLLNEQIQRFDFAQGEPWQRLQDFASLIGAPITGDTLTRSIGSRDSAYMTRVGGALGGKN